jgi:hypothetical protein
MKLDINSAELHPQLSHNGHPVDGVLVHSRPVHICTGKCPLDDKKVLWWPGFCSTQRPKCKPGCISTWLTKSTPLHQELKHIGWRAINKPLEGESRWLSGEGTRATLHINPVAQPPHQSLARKLCDQAWLSVNVRPLSDHFVGNYYRQS